MSVNKYDREFTRVSLHLTGEITCGEETISSKECQNVSMNDVYVISENNFKENSNCEIKLFVIREDLKEEIKAMG
jgi:hypothetical protein